MQKWHGRYAKVKNMKAKDYINVISKNSERLDREISRLLSLGYSEAQTPLIANHSEIKFQFIKFEEELTLKAIINISDKKFFIQENILKDSNPPVKSSRSVYLMKNHRNGYFKIGISGDVQYRERTLQSEEPEVALIYSSVKTTEAKKIEGYLHEKFREKRLRGEWFHLTVEDVDYIKLYIESRIHSDFMKETTF